MALCKDCYYWMIAINKPNVKSEAVYAEPQLINSSIIFAAILDRWNQITVAWKCKKENKIYSLSSKTICK